ncbi:MAG: AbrB/MazE/SpoVT family DNA-binding domain-containing protein [Actinobacteria bacterium]|nr:AbrB/MazE/SpoVT family DNA-binding domain-containing protein [Actinomycetota bacterium]
MPRITTKGQITIPKEIRDKFNIKPHDIGEFIVKEGKIIFTVKKGTILDAHIEKVDKKIDFKKLRERMEKDIAEEIVRKMK